MKVQQLRRSNVMLPKSKNASMMPAFKPRQSNQSVRARALTKKIGCFIAAGLHSYPVIEEPAFLELMKCAVPEYNVPSGTTFLRTVVSEMYDAARSSRPRKNLPPGLRTVPYAQPLNPLFLPFYSPPESSISPAEKLSEYVSSLGGEKEADFLTAFVDSNELIYGIVIAHIEKANLVYEKRAVLALDMKGAFDNVSHTLVFENLASTGCGPRMYDYVRDFRSNCMATIGVESIRTSTTPSQARAPRKARSCHQPCYLAMCKPPLYWNGFPG
ncbi:hypothetical protein HPB47_004975 [Ixodes persulcatus]|uniref:Uncharacterized protein n=1 Tax=Ixodes persulcatus TaxID=34615 RepID=A0AC60PEA0_IXOPE|nr:hypothetical protein HPB47_004975 [Ixodes persulcatus]